MQLTSLGRLVLLAAAAILFAQTSPAAGKPVLIVGSNSNPYSFYNRELLQAEGLNVFDSADIASVSAASLAAYDIVLLGHVPLTSDQAAVLTNWVNGGGYLIAMRPDKQLAALLGIADTGSTLSNTYLAVNTAVSPGQGITSQPLQFHGSADLYLTTAAAAVATLYTTRTSATSFPAVTLRTGIGNGGKAAAFTYDLARSVVYTRQGNPAWSGQARIGIGGPIRSSDMFYGNAVFDPQPDWVDLANIAIPQADEQQRLLVNLIHHMNLSRKPLPRFWYFPSGKRAVVVMTGDDHGQGATAGRFDDYLAKSPAGCSVPNWECIRGTSYIYPSTPLSDAQAATYTSQGFEVALHVNTNCANFTLPTLQSFFATQLSSFASSYPSLPAPVTNRTHCIAFSDWSSTPVAEASHGIRLDTNYYYWPASWVVSTPGFFTGSGIPMRFAQTDGTPIDVYQATTQLTDESGQAYPATIDVLLDNALGSAGFYGAFTANIHTDSNSGNSKLWSDQIVASAQARGVSIITAKQLLDWLNTRNGSTFSWASWTGNTLTFTVTATGSVNGLMAMLPISSQAGGLSSITRNGAPVSFSAQTVKGVGYAFFPAASGTYQASYGGTAPPVITSVSAAPGATSAAVAWFTDKPSNSRVDFGTSPSLLGQTVSSAAMATSHSVNLTGLASGTVYYYRVTSVDASNGSATSPAATAVPATFTTVDPNPPVISALAVVPGNNGLATVTWTTNKPSTSRVAYGPSTGSLNLDANDPAMVTAHTVTLSGLVTGNTYYLRVTSVDSLNNSSTAPAPPNPPTSFVQSPLLSIWNSSAVPAIVDSGDPAPVELGLKFRSDVAGMVTGIRFYKAAANTGTHTGKLWSASGALLGTVTFTNETTSGWQQAMFAAPVSIAANTTYVVSYFAPNGRYSKSVDYFTSSGVNSPPLRALAAGVEGPNGVYTYSASSTFPGQTYFNTNYWVDITFVAAVDPNPPVITAVTATPGGDGSATITWATNKASTSRVEYGTAPNSLALQVTGSAMVTAHSIRLPGLSTGVSYYFRVSSADSNGNTAASPAVPDPPAVFIQTVPISVWNNTTVPALPDAGDAGAVELGMKFRSDLAGAVTGIRFYKAAANTGVHTGKLWTSTGTLLASVTFSGETASGWQQAAFAAPVPISANTTYIVSYYAPNGHYSANSAFFATSGVNSGPLRALASGVDGLNGVFAYGAASTFPTQSYQNTNYWVDVLFADNVPPVISSVSAVPDAASAVISWTSNEPSASRVDYGTSPGALTASASNAAFTTANSVTLTGLTTGATYYYRAVSIDASGNSTTYPAAANPPGTFIPTAPPVISALAASPGSNSALITWTTDRTATSRVDFGTSPGALTQTVSSPDLVTGHSVRLTGLTAGAIYYYRATSVDASGRSITAPLPPAVPASFSTVDANPPILSGVTAISAGSGATTITWTTNKHSNSRVEFGLSPAALSSNVSDPAMVTVHTVTLSGLTAGTAYYYRVVSTDSNNNSTTAPAPPAAPASFTQQGDFRFWSNSTVPAIIDTGDAGSVELGMKFRSDVAGTVTGVRFYKAAANTGTHTGSLWTSTGTLLGTVTFTDETASGWQEASFATPIPIAANTTYVVSYFAPNGRYSINSSYFTSNGVDSLPLHALASGVDGPNGLYRYGSQSAFPSQSFQNANYWVDVSFTYAAPGIAAEGLTVTATSATVTWTTYEPAASRVDYGTSPTAFTSSITNPALVTSHSVTLNGLTSGTTYYYRIVATNASGVSAVSPPLATAPARFVPTGAVTIWAPTTVPAVVDSGDTGSVELGLKFRSDVAGSVTGVRFYKSAANTGTHTGRLWSSTGALLGTVTFTNETASGWQQANFASPIPIAANTTYVVSYLAPNGRYSVSSNAFASAGVSTPPLRALASGVDGANGVFRYGTGGVFPVQSYQNSNYWVDVSFTPAAN